MNRVFMKLFLAFALNTALTLALLAAVSVTLRQDPLFARWVALHGSAGTLPLVARGAVREYERGGAAGLAAYRTDAEQTALLRLWLFDDAGRDLSGGAPPRAVAEAGGAYDDRTGIGDVLRRRGVVPVLGAGGTRYVVVAEQVQEPGPAPALRLAVAIGATLAVCYVLAHALTRPLLALRHAAGRLADGDLTARSGAAQGSDEIAQLAREFDAMAEKLEASVGAQRRLLGDISHELRSPLARLGVALELARQRVGEGSPARASLDRIEREAGRMDSLVGEMLTLTRLERAGEARGPALPETAGPVDLSALVREVAEDADYEARARGCRVDPSGVSGPVLLSRAEGELLRRAVENVVRNAIRYTAEGTAVAVEVTAEAGVATVAVRDRGPGVPESALPHLFRPFYRVEGDRDRSSGGAGLGLAIAERAVRLHGGTIRAENAPGGGLVVRLRLPLQDVRQADGGTGDTGHGSTKATSAPPSAAGRA